MMITTTLSVPNMGSVISTQKEGGRDITGEGGGHTPDQPNLSQDALFDVLSNRRRRYVVHALKREDTPTEIGCLAEQVAAWENGVAIQELSHDQRKRVYTALQQSHLPRMADIGVVEFDKNRGVIEPTPALEDVDLYLDPVQGNDIPWSEYYLGLSAVATALVAAVSIHTWPFALLPDLAWMVAIVVIYTVSAAVHHYYSSQMRLGESENPPELEL